MPPANLGQHLLNPGGEETGLWIMFLLFEIRLRSDGTSISVFQTLAAVLMKGVRFISSSVLSSMVSSSAKLHLDLSGLGSSNGSVFGLEHGVLGVFSTATYNMPVDTMSRGVGLNFENAKSVWSPSEVQPSGTAHAWRRDNALCSAGMQPEAHATQSHLHSLTHPSDGLLLLIYFPAAAAASNAFCRPSVAAHAHLFEHLIADTDAGSRLTQAGDLVWTPGENLPPVLIARRRLITLAIPESMRERLHAPAPARAPVHNPNSAPKTTAAHRRTHSPPRCVRTSSPAFDFPDVSDLTASTLQADLAATKRAAVGSNCSEVRRNVFNGGWNIADRSSHNKLGNSGLKFGSQI
ncbi:hypothetical protein GGX14DRAFT_656875 [Mycena pura]|uniref:Uncharacterized protein n=1 Tax=Mycena pura TaxID=153505 RepID=A0AAD6YLN9_9AGAR|nr:hypothetical protein GGX14DRAFT_656875 [Mycena pura]